MNTPHPVRRSDREITNIESIDSIIGQGRYVTFALCDADGPYAVTLSYGYDPSARAMYMHVAPEGRKLDAIRRDPRACGTVVIDGGYNQGECEHPYRSVVMFGAMRIIEDPAEKRHAIETLVRHLEDDPSGYWDTRSWDLDSRLGGFSALAFEIESLTAKQGK